MAEKFATTAIADAPFESLVAKTLFDNGWNVKRRLIEIGDEILDDTEFLVISLDIEGLTQEKLNTLTQSFQRIIVFGPNPRNLDSQGAPIYEPIHDSLSLLPILRGSARSPLIHSAPMRKHRAELLLFLSTRSNVGGSYLAAQSAFELSTHQKRVLLVDGDCNFPSAYFHLGARDLSEPQALTPYLSAVELSTYPGPEKIQSLERWLQEFDYLILDHGVLIMGENLGSDRRLGAQILTWSLDLATRRVVVTSPGELELHTHKEVMEQLRVFKPQAKFVEVVNKFQGANKSASPTFNIPLDIRAVAKCQKEKLLIGEGAPRSALAKSVVQFVREGLM